MHVLVRTFAGCELQLDVDPCCTVLALKHKVAQQWGVPTLCQSLTHRAAVMSDLDVLVTTADKDVIVTNLVVSYERLYELVSSGSHRERERAVEDLALVAHRDYQRAVTALSMCAGDRIKTVKLAAIDGLVKVSQIGEACAVNALRLSLSDRSREVREAAVEALPRVLNWSDEDAAIDFLQLCLTSEAEVTMKLAAVEAIGDAAGRGQVHATFALNTCLKDPSAAVRRVAVEALAKVAPDGDQSTVAALYARTVDVCREVRAAAILALAKVAAASEPRAVAAARECSQDSEAEVRRAAAAALALMDLNLEEELPVNVPCARDA